MAGWPHAAAMTFAMRKLSDLYATKIDDCRAGRTGSEELPRERGVPGDMRLAFGRAMHLQGERERRVVKCNDLKFNHFRVGRFRGCNSG